MEDKEPASQTQTESAPTETPKKIVEVSAEESARYYGQVITREMIKHKRKELKVDFRQLTEHNVGQLKMLLDKTLPVTYQNDFYNRLVSYQRYSKLAYFKDILIGAITCKEDQLPVGDIKEPQSGAYIMTITVFERYRRYGIASQLLQEAINDCCKAKSIDYIFLDVQENNESALEFYKKHGFAVSHKRENYYTNIEPASSYFLYKKLEFKEEKLDLPREGSGDQETQPAPGGEKTE